MVTRCIRSKQQQKLEEDLLRQQKDNTLALRRLKVFYENEKPILFEGFLQEDSIIIIFVRHFGCIACRAHVDQIWNLFRGSKRSSARIIFIGNGRPYVIKDFKDDMDVRDAEIYTDPSLESFDACGMNRSIAALLNFKSIAAMRRLKAQGYRQGSFEDSGVHRQLGGVVAFRKPGILTYHFTSRHLGDFDNPDDWPK